MENLSHRLPEELLLKIAYQLPDSSDPVHLKNLCLVSKLLMPAAQEILHNDVTLCTNKQATVGHRNNAGVNPALRFLRTILDRPDLAVKVKALWFKTTRADIAKGCMENQFDVSALRLRCALTLEKLGYCKTDLWVRALENSIESAFMGLLFVLIPNLTRLDFVASDSSGGHPSHESVSSLFGSMILPHAVLGRWKGVHTLAVRDSSLLRCGMEFENLTSLRLKYLETTTIPTLNGPGSFEGTTKLRNLTVDISTMFVVYSAVRWNNLHWEILGSSWLPETTDAPDLYKLPRRRGVY